MKRITLRIWSLCACFAACEESGTFPDTGNEPNAVRFSVTTSDTQNPVTRAYDTWWEKNDEIGIYMYRTATPDFTTLNTKEHNAEYAVTTNTDAKTTGLQPVSKHLIFPADGSKVNFIAYYPYQAGVNGGIYKIDLTTQARAKDHDLMYGTTVGSGGYDKNSAPVALTFAHRLVVLEIRVDTSPDKYTGAGKLTGVSIEGVYKTADFNLATGKLTTSGTRGTVRATQSGLQPYRIVVLPTAGQANVRMRLTVDGKTYTYNVPDTQRWEANTKYSYTFRLTDAGGLSLPSMDYTDKMWPAGIFAWDDVWIVTASDALLILSDMMPSFDFVFYTTATDVPIVSDMSIPAAWSYNLTEDVNYSGIYGEKKWMIHVETGTTAGTGKLRIELNGLIFALEVQHT